MSSLGASRLEALYVLSTNHQQTRNAGRLERLGMNTWAHDPACEERRVSTLQCCITLNEKCSFGNIYAPFPTSDDLGVLPVLLCNAIDLF